MPSQAGSYGALLAGGVLVVAGFSGHSIKDVLAGKPSPLKGLMTEPTATPTPAAGGSGMALASYQTGGVAAPSGNIPSSAGAARQIRGLGTFDGHRVALWIIPFLAYARAHGWKGQVTSGYRSRAEQARIYASGVRPAARPGTSNHEGRRFPRGAVDVTDASELAAILSHIPGGSLLRWAGSKDPVHFSFPHNGGY